MSSINCLRSYAVLWNAFRNRKGIPSGKCIWLIRLKWYFHQCIIIIQVLLIIFVVILSFISLLIFNCLKSQASWLESFEKDNKKSAVRKLFSNYLHHFYYFVIITNNQLRIYIVSSSFTLYSNHSDSYAVLCNWHLGWLKVAKW